MGTHTKHLPTRLAACMSPKSRREKSGREKRGGEKEGRSCSGKTRGGAGQVQPIMPETVDFRHDPVVQLLLHVVEEALTVRMAPRRVVRTDWRRQRRSLSQSQLSDHLPGVPHIRSKGQAVSAPTKRSIDDVEFFRVTRTNSICRSRGSHLFLSNVLFLSTSSQRSSSEDVVTVHRSRNGSRVISAAHTTTQLPRQSRN